MGSWVANPVFQSAVAPFLAGIVLAPLLKPLRLSGLAILAGAVTCDYLAMGLDLVPLSATRKIILLGLAGAALGVVLDLLPSLRRGLRPAVAVLGAAAAVWVLFPALSHRELASALVLGAGLAVFCAVVVWGFDALAERPIRAGSAALAMGLAAGGAAIVGASASLGQVGLAIGAASGGYLLVQMLSGKLLPCGRTLTLPVALFTGLIAAAAVVLARLPWHVLPLLAVIPFAAALPVGDRLPVWLQAFVHSAIAFVFGATALAVAWQLAGEASY